MVIHGRSDATLNPGGVRIGTAEIYRQVELLRRGAGERRHRPGLGQRCARRAVRGPEARARAWTIALRDRIKKQIRVGASPRHVPARIIQVADIPRSKSGKISELAVRDIVHGRDIKNREALANPEAARHLSQHGRAGALTRGGGMQPSSLRHSRIDGSR